MGFGFFQENRQTRGNVGVKNASKISDGEKMAEIVMKDYLAMLEKSRLFESRADLEECLKKWRAANQNAAENSPKAFAEWLIENDFITQWQSDNIFAGKYKGFFLGKYKLLRSIGAGGMSSVYLAVHTLLERQVAIKVLPKSRVTSDSSYLERFLLEAQAVAALDHPNIVRAYDVDTEGNSIYYLVMEFIDGPDLLSYVKKEGPLDIYRAAKYIRQAATGLHHAHLAGLIHRDMKPANLLIDSEDNVHVLDLGLARFTDEKRASLTLTYDENVLGTADYLAPEQARNSHTVDARADIYGLGCTLYYLLVGHVPFPEGTLAQRIAAHQKRMPAPIRDERPEVPEDLAALCWKMMAKDPNDRQQTAEETADDLTFWLLENGQKVEGFTGSISSLQKKKIAAENQKTDAFQTDAQKELDSFSEFASLANLGVNAPKNSPAAQAGKNSPETLRSNSAAKNKSGDELKQQFFSILGKVNTIFDAPKKGKKSPREPLKNQTEPQKPENDTAKITPETFSFGDPAQSDEGDSVLPSILDFSARELRKSEDSALKNQESLHIDLPLPKREKEKESPEAALPRETVLDADKSGALQKQGSSISSKSTVFAASTARKGSSIQRKIPSDDQGLMDFLTQKTNDTGSDSTVRSSSGSNIVLNLGGETAGKSASSLKRAEISGKAGSSVRLASKTAAGIEKNASKAAPAAKNARSAQKINEKKLYALVALGFFIVLVLLAILAL